MDKLKIILDLVRRGAITDEQAQALLHTEKEYVYRDVYHPRQYNWPWTYPYYYGGVTYTSNTLSNGVTFTTATDNNCINTCGCTTEDCDSKQAQA